jgi:hypothetical protein
MLLTAGKMGRYYWWITGKNVNINLNGYRLSQRARCYDGLFARSEKLTIPNEYPFFLEIKLMAFLLITAHFFKSRLSALDSDNSHAEVLIFQAAPSAIKSYLHSNP